MIELLDVDSASLVYIHKNITYKTGPETDEATG